MAKTIFRQQEEERQLLGEKERRRESERKEYFKDAKTFLKEGHYVYQEETGFVHDGIITLAELEKYENQIQGREKTNKSFIKNFRIRMTQMMMVDPSFAKLLSKYSPEYAAIAEEAAAREKALERKANISGFNKVMHGVGIAEKQNARDELKKLHAAKDSEYRDKYDTNIRRAKWLDARDNMHLGEKDSVADRLRQRKSDPEKAAADTVLSSLKASIKDRPAYYGISTEEMDSISKGYSEGPQIVHYAQKYVELNSGEKLKGDSAAHNLLKRVAFLSDSPKWYELLDDTKTFLMACGEGKFAEEEKKNAFDTILGRINDWGEGILESPLIKRLKAANGNPAPYIDMGVQEQLPKMLDQCDGMLDLLGYLKKGTVYRNQASKEDMEELAALTEWARGIKNYLEAVIEHAGAWDDFYRSEYELPLEKRPKRLPPLARFLGGFNVSEG